MGRTNQLRLHRDVRGFPAAVARAAVPFARFWLRSRQRCRDDALVYPLLHRRPMQTLPEPAPDDIDAIIDAIAAFDNAAPKQKSFRQLRTWQAALAAHEPLAVARAALKRCATVKLGLEAHRTLDLAMGSVVDVMPLVGIVRELWHGEPTGTFYHRHLISSVGIAARHDRAFRTELVEELFSNTDDARRLHIYIVRALGATGHADVVSALCRLAQRDRERPSHPVRHDPTAWVSWRNALIEALGDLGDPGAWPTMMIEAASPDLQLSPQSAEALVKLGGERISPFVLRVVTALSEPIAVVRLAGAIPLPAIDEQLVALAEATDERALYTEVTAILRLRACGHAGAAHRIRRTAPPVQTPGADDRKSSHVALAHAERESLAALEAVFLSQIGAEP